LFGFSNHFLQIFSPEVTLIRDQVWINVGAYGTKCRSIYL